MEDIESCIAIINQAIEKYPKGCDLSVPRDMMDKVEEYCDELGIPCYVSTYCGDNAYFSVAASYKKLMFYEKAR